MNNLVDKWINISSVGFWEPIPNIKIQTSSKVNKKIGVKSANELITVNPNRDLFGRLSWALNCL